MKVGRQFQKTNINVLMIFVSILFDIQTFIVEKDIFFNFLTPVFQRMYYKYSNLLYPHSTFA